MDAPGGVHRTDTEDLSAPLVCDRVVPTRNAPSADGETPVPRTIDVILLMVIVTAGVGLALVGGATPADAQSSNLTVDRTVAPSTAAPGDEVTVTTTVTFDSTVSGTLTESVMADDIHLDVLDDDGATELNVNESSGNISARYDGVNEIVLVYQVTLPDADDDVTIDGYWTNGTDRSLGTAVIDVTSEPIYAISEVFLPDSPTTAETFNVDVAVRNRGISAGRAPMELSIDGAPVANTSVNLSPNESATVTFSDIRLTDPGTYQLSVNTPNDSASATLEVGDAMGSLTLQNQALGVGPEGESAIGVDEVTGDAGWYLVATVEDGLDDRVIGYRQLTTSSDGSSESLPIDDADAVPGEIRASLVGQGVELSIGDPIPSSAEVVASATGRIVNASVTMANQTGNNVIETVTVSEASIAGSGSGSTPFMVVLHRRDGTGLGPIIGTSSVLWGSQSDVTIPLDEPIEGDQSVDVAAAMYFVNAGEPGAELTALIGSERRAVQSHATLTVEAIPILSIDAVDVSTQPTGSTTTVTVTVTNGGASMGSQSLWVSLGSHVRLPTVAVEAGETATVTTDIQTTAADAGERRLRVETLDDRVTRNVTLSSPTPTPTTTPSDGSPGPGLGLAIGALLLTALAVRFGRHR